MIKIGVGGDGKDITRSFIGLLGNGRLVFLGPLSADGKDRIIGLRRVRENELNQILALLGG
jgi:hypothetical protein